MPGHAGTYDDRDQQIAALREAAEAARDGQKMGPFRKRATAPLVLYLCERSQCADRLPVVEAERDWLEGILRNAAAARTGWDAITLIGDALYDLDTKRRQGHPIEADGDLAAVPLAIGEAHHAEPDPESVDPADERIDASYLHRPIDGPHRNSNSRRTRHAVMNAATHDANNAYRYETLCAGDA